MKNLILFCFFLSVSSCVIIGMDKELSMIVSGANNIKQGVYEIDFSSDPECLLHSKTTEWEASIIPYQGPKHSYSGFNLKIIEVGGSRRSFDGQLKNATPEKAIQFGILYKEESSRSSKTNVALVLSKGKQDTMLVSINPDDIEYMMECIQPKSPR